eukprot:1945636-Amphidinium_carterae.1
MACAGGEFMKEGLAGLPNLVSSTNRCSDWVWLGLTYRMRYQRAQPWPQGNGGGRSDELLEVGRSVRLPSQLKPDVERLAELESI